MTESSQTPVRFFLAQLTLPVRKCMVRAAVECAGQVAEALSLDAREAGGVKLAVDEAFCNAVDHFSGIAREDERIHLEFYVEGDRWSSPSGKRASRSITPGRNGSCPATWKARTGPGWDHC